MQLNKPTFSAQVQGRSFFLNALFSCLNITAFVGILLAFIQKDNLTAILYGSISGLLFLISVFAIIVLKGRRLFATISSFLLGLVLIVSGFIKLNDPIGFSYKLEEYFQDGALAYRIRDVLGIESFSLEGFVPFSLWIGFILCAIEITCGVLLVIRANLKKTIYVVFVMLFFFLFLTGHTATCDAGDTFQEKTIIHKDVDGADSLLVEAKKDKLCRIQVEGGNFVVSRQRHVQCVSDCGCFGDALKSSIGRSLTPTESFLKDVFLIYLSIWVFLARRRIHPNEKDQNIRTLIALLLFTVPFAVLFDWYTLLFIVPAITVLGLWCVRTVKYERKSYLWATTMVVISCFVFFSAAWTFGPFKDFSPYAKGSNLAWKMSDGSPGKFESLLEYKNRNTGEKIEYNANSVEYSNSQIWEKDEWSFVKMQQKELEAPRSASITEQFDPIAPVSSLIDVSCLSKELKGCLNKATERGEKTISIRKLVYQSKKMVLVVVRNVTSANWDRIDRWKGLSEKCKQQDITFVVVTNSSVGSINRFRQDQNWDVPFFQNDDTELKVISRLSPSVLFIEKGIVIEKHSFYSLPTIERLNFF